MEAKPICVIYYLPEAMASASGKMSTVYEVNSMFRDIFTDYHTLAIPSRLSSDGSCEDIRLEVFHPKDFTEVNYEELKSIINDKIQNIKQ